MVMENVLKSGSNTSVVLVSYSCRTKIVVAVLDRQRSGVKATIWWFCHDRDRSGRSAMIGNIGFSRQSSALLALWGDSVGTGGFPSQRASNAEKVSIWWGRHAIRAILRSCSTLPLNKARWAHIGPTWSRQDPRWANVWDQRSLLSRLLTDKSARDRSKIAPWLKIEIFYIGKFLFIV